MFAALRRIFGSHHARRTASVEPASTGPEIATPSTRGFSGESSFEAAPTKVTVQRVSNASAAEDAKIRQAAGLMQKVLGSSQFRDEVLAQRGMINTEGLSNEQIYQRILEGSEGATPGADHEADLSVALYNKWNRWSREVAWSGAHENAIHFNRKFFSGFEANDVAGTLSHEWCHQLGFNDSGANPSSVPYRVGEIVSRLAENPQALTPVGGEVPVETPAETPAEPARATLRRGAQGEEVQVLQQLLSEAGFSPGPADGDFGRYTERALRAFQRSRGLPATGVADAATWAALEA